MQRIVPCIWFDHVAEEAANFYVDSFRDARIVDVVRYPEEGLAEFQREFAGQALTVDIEVASYRLTLLNAGPEFPVNPSVSFMVNFDPAVDGDARAHLDELHGRLMDGGTELMPLGEYLFSPHYAWVQDRYGVSWQLMLTNPAGDPRPFLIPSIMFGNLAQNRAEEAIGHYTSLLGGEVGTLVRWPEPMGPATAGSVMFADFTLLGQWFAAMDAGSDQEAAFNCGVSLIVEADGQAELDRWWDALSAVPEAEQCGWLADRFGLSWQIVPVNLPELMTKPGAFEKLMEMKKIEIAAFG